MHLSGMAWYASVAMRYAFGDYELDDQLYELRHAGEPVELERKVYDVLAYLVQHHDRLVTKDELLDQLWPGQVVGEAALTRCITSARKVLGDDGNRQEFIKTQYSRGYRFVATVSEPPTTMPDARLREHDEQDTHKRRGEHVISSNGGVQVNKLPITEHEQATSSLPLTSDASAPSRSPTPPRSYRGLVLLLCFILLLGIIFIAEWRFVRSLDSPPPSTTDSLALPLPDKPSIAVLPFTNLSGDPEQEYFSDGITDDIITALSKIASLFVIARNSTFTYKGEVVDVGEISHELGVLKDVFALQDEITQQIVLALKIKVLPEEQARFRQAPTTNLEAYNAYLRGLTSVWRLSKGANLQARQLFKRALELDPKYAAAYAGLGWTHFIDWSHQWDHDHEGLEQAFSLAQKVTVLDESLPWAYQVLSIVYLAKKRLEQAISTAERAITLDPNRSESYVFLAEGLYIAGRPEKAIKAVKTAMRLDPHYPIYYVSVLGQAYARAGRYEEALTALKKVVTRNPHYLVAHLTLALLYSERGQAAEARAEVAEILKLSPTYSIEEMRKRFASDDQIWLEQYITALRKAGLK